MIYLDSSHLAKLYVREPDSGAVLHAIGAEKHLVVSDVAFVEFHSAVRRRQREGTLSPAEAQATVSHFSDDWPGYDRVPVSHQVLSISVDLLARHPLRSLDAIQLASAVLTSSGAPARIRFGSADIRLLETARKEGLEVLLG